MSKLQAKNAALDLTTFPEENPSPVLRTDGEGRILYSNSAGRALPGLIDSRGLITAALRNPIIQAHQGGNVGRAEFASEGRVFALSIVPVREAGYVNLYGRDITEERQALAQVYDLARFPEENPSPVLRTDGKGRVLYSNAAGRRLTGLIGEDDVLCDAVRLAIVAAVEENRVGRAEFSAEDRSFVLIVAPVSGTGYVNLYGRDVTDERAALQQIQDLAKFPEENPNPVMRVGADGTLIYANSASYALPRLLSDGALQPALASTVTEAYRAGRIRTSEFLAEDRIFLFAVTPIAGKGYANLYGRDVTEERRAHQKILEMMNFNASILENLSNGIVTLDRALRITKANPAAVRILEWRGDDLLGREIVEVFGAANGWICEQLQKVMADKTSLAQLDREIELAHGRAITVNLTLVPLLDADGRLIGAMAVLEDITREKRIKSTMVRFMSDGVVERLLDIDESLLEGATQEVAILFSDIREFTALSERLGAKEMVGVLNDYFSAMVDIIFEHHGTLDKFIGDAIMAVFGAPLSSADDTRNAVAAAIEMLVRLRGFNESMTGRGRTPLRIGIGIDTGPVVAGTIGSPKRMDYTVIGEHVNLASRIEAANKYFGTDILISEDTLNLLSDLHRIRELDLVRVKGQERPVTLYEVLDYHTEESFPNMDRSLLSFEEGRRLYLKREWKRGAGYFAEALRANPHDRPTQIYLARCWSNMARPPDENWTAVTDLSDL